MSEKKHFQKSVRCSVSALTLLAAALLCTAVCSCSRKDVPETVTQIIQAVSKVPQTHTWYSFTQNGFEETALPAATPDYPYLPWTEATRISSVAATEKSLYFTVNRRGLLECVPGKKTGSSTVCRMIQDARFFPERTVDSIVLIEGNPVIKLYNDLLFNENNRVQKDNPFLIQYRTNTGVFYPLFFNRDINLKNDYQITTCLFDGKSWVVCAKSSDETETDFEYRQFTPPENYYRETMGTTGSGLETKSISLAEYQEATRTYSFDQAPERLRTLLEVLPENFEFSITVTDTSKNNSARTYIRGKGGVTAYAFLTETCTTALFSDGTGYFAGALADEHILNDGKPFTFLLPALPAGITYGTFGLCGRDLYVAWEDTSFFKTGKTGFLKADMKKVLYER